MKTDQFRLIDFIDDIFAGKDVFFNSLHVAEDFMTKNVKTLTLDDKVDTCLRFMEENNVRHMPVVDFPGEKEGKAVFVGVVSQRDVLRQISLYVGKIGQKETDEKALKMPLVQIETRSPKTVSPETPICQVIQTMLDNHIDALPVVVNRQVVGIITTDDIIKLLVRLEAICNLCRQTSRQTRLIDLISDGTKSSVADCFSSVLRTVQDIMSKPVVCLDEQDRLNKAMDTMRVGNFRHVPIVDKQKKLVGIVSDRDVLRALPYIGRQVQSQTKGFRASLFTVKPEDPSLGLPLGEIMTKNIACLQDNGSVFDAAKTMHQKKVSCLPVVDDEKKLLGIVTVTDVMRALLSAYQIVAKSGVSSEPVANVTLSH